MNIVELKGSLFGKLPHAMTFLENKGFETVDVPNKVKKFGQTIYFYHDDQDWLETTPKCRVIDSCVNDFDHTEHKIVLDCPPAWFAETLLKLKAASKLAFETNVVTTADESFESFWARCKVPDSLSMQKNAHARRGRRKLFIPLFHDNKEITGRVNPDKNAIVQAVVRWCLHDTSADGYASFGWRAHFGGGLKIQQLGADAPLIREPWSWLDVNFESLTVPLYDTLSVKMPCFTIVNVSDNTVTVHASDAFTQAMCDFHTQAGSELWSGRVEMPTSCPAELGQRIMATITPSRIGNNISWYVQKHRLLPGREISGSLAGKRCADNTDNSESAQTKRQRIVDETGVHKTG
tara:strand:+ start:28839 stop:29885 length:1047 start_codon:yes stop_codon:yes gene_type:complete